MSTTSLQFPGLPTFRFWFDIGPETVLLDQAPDGWLQSIIEFANSKNYAALRRSLSLPYKFVGNGAYLCRREYYGNTNGLVMANIQLRIEMLQQDFSYLNIYTGKLDFTKKEDGSDYFSVPAISNDFSLNIDTYDSVNYAIPLDDGINLEITALSINETATYIPSGPPDGNIHSDYFVPMQLVNNVQSSVSPSVQGVPYSQLNNPDFGSSKNWFFDCQKTGKLYITGALSGTIYGDAFGVPNIRLSIFDSGGNLIYNFVSAAPAAPGAHDFNLNINTIIDVNIHTRYFVYMDQVGDETDNTGITIKGGQLDLSYQTQSPASMCKALSGEQLFSKLLIAMNPNLNETANQPVPYQCFLLRNALKNVFFTSSDSIRSGNGSFYASGDTIGTGIYKVVAGEILYGAINIGANQQFSFNGTLTFSQVGGTYAYIQKIQSIFVGAVYNAGDTIPAGGTFLVEGLPGEYITYNGDVIYTGSYFNYVLNQSTFAVSNPDVFVKQTGEDPQIVISFANFFQAIKSFMGGNASNGYYNGLVFLEDLTMVYQNISSGVNLGNVGPDWKSKSAVDKLFANFKVGYQDQQYDSVNGAQEVNSTQEYTSALMLTTKTAAPGTFPNELNLISPIRTDPYGIEQLRVTESNSAASQSNNDTWAIWINPVPVASNSGFTYYHPALAADSLQSLTGVDQTYYNFFLSPKQNLLRGAPYLASIFYNMGDYPIKLASALKNSGMVTIDLNGRRVAEADSVLASTLGPPLFIPEYYVGLQGLSYDILIAVTLNPYTYLTFNINGMPVTAFIDDFKFAFAENAPQNIQLLLAPGNDLTKFIRY